MRLDDLRRRTKQLVSRIVRFCAVQRSSRVRRTKRPRFSVAKHPWLIGMLTALFCLCGFPFFGYRLIADIKRGLVVHILFWLVNACCFLLALALFAIAGAMVNDATLGVYATIVFRYLWAIPLAGFLAATLCCVGDTVRLAHRQNAARGR